MLGSAALFGTGLLLVNVGEWVAHKYILHGLGKKKDALFSFHWSNHHRVARKNGFMDEQYRNRILSFDWNAHSKELVSLCVAALTLGGPALVYVPALGLGIEAGILLYYLMHRYGHLHPEWAKKWMKGHWEHHMLGDQSHSWCVTSPLTDIVMGTRYKGKRNALVMVSNDNTKNAA